MESLVSCRGVSLTYDGLRHAVAELSFDVRPGSIFALVGPNGAGKTSILRILATLLKPTSGTVHVDGIDAVADEVGVRRRIGYLPDHFALYDALTPVDYLDFFARLHEVDPAVRSRRIDVLLEELDLGEKRAAPIRTLSRGMRQRLGLGKTLIHEPRLLLLDEPASALDPGARERLKQILVGLRRRGIAIVISSHILPDLADIADAVGIMEGGRMIECGAISEVARAARAGRTTYRLEVCAHLDRVRGVLAGFGPRVGGVEERGPGVFEVELEGGEAAAADLLEALVLRGSRVCHLAPRESALEAVYRASAAAKVA
jgi:ABC-2 type transport system ATP-binding protein